MLNTINGYLNASLKIASAAAVTTATPLQICSLFVPEGTWLVTGAVIFIPTATTSVTVLQACLNATTATMSTGDNGLATFETAANVLTTAGAGYILQLPQVPLIVTTTLGATYYLNANAVFTASTLTAAGYVNLYQIAQ